MIRSFLSVGLWTLLSRATGFLRDILLASHLGVGLLMDAFTIAFRLPNHFRAIFAEGAFNTAFVPAFARIRTASGERASMVFQGQVLGMMLAAQLCLLALVLAFTPAFVALLAPGFSDRPEAMRLAIDLTRITFPYLALITLVVLWSGVLNAEKRFVEGAAAPVLLNLAMISTLLLGGFFATYAHAAAWGVLLAGFCEAGLLAFGAWRAGLLTLPRRPALTPETRAFFAAFGPAVIGAAGVQIAMLADTIIVTFLPQGGASALYYADRLYQLPVGVIGIAAGTVLLPEMSRLIASGRDAAAHQAQNRALALSWLLAMPFMVAFLLVPELIVAALFGYGAFSGEAVRATAAVLQAYAFGLFAVVAIRSVVASFHARGDTRTPLYASLSAIGLNLALKLVLWRDYGAAGLAAATAFGALVNLVLLAFLALRSGKAKPDRDFALVLAVILVACIWMIAALRALAGFSLVSSAPPLLQLVVYGVVGLVSYGGFALLGLRLAGLGLNLRRS